MFGWLKRKKQTTAMDAFVHATYGPDAKKTADLAEAVLLANDLVGGKFEHKELSKLASSLNEGPIPYSTHDLAVSTALGLLKQVPRARRAHLMNVQFAARMTVASWATEGRVILPLAAAFEDTLYREYRPDMDSAR